jgi:hypothetical protein
LDDRRKWVRNETIIRAIWIVERFSVARSWAFELGVDVDGLRKLYPRKKEQDCPKYELKHHLKRRIPS